jgi:hypothetical protein
MKHEPQQRTGSAPSTESQLRNHLDTLSLFQRTTFKPSTLSPTLLQRVIYMTGAPLRQGYCNEEQLPYENRLAIESRDL